MESTRHLRLTVKKRNTYAAALIGLWIALFMVAKAAFLYYNRDIEPLSLGEMWDVLMHGLLLDLRTSALLTLPVAVAMAAMRRRAGWLVVPYLTVASFFVGLVVAADMVMYEFWEFKLCAVHLSYAASPEGTTNSVSTWFLVSRLLMIGAFWLPLLWAAVRLWPGRADGERTPWSLVVCLLCAACPVGVRSAYHDAPLFRCHAATNPMFRFASSYLDDRRFSRMGETAADTDAAPMEEYRTSNAIADTLLATDRPNVLLIVMESFGGKFVEELGGLPGVAPQLSRLIPESIFWENYYSNSFRTNRGIVSICSGWLSYPTLSLMERPAMHGSIPSLSRSFQQAGYRTGYMYGGSMSNMGKEAYLCNMGFEAIMDEKYFDRSQLTGGWGADDGTAARRMLETIADVDTTARWMMVWQTLSSHEPWEVPYHRLDDAKLNAFAYTDDCVGQLVDSLRTLPAWDNLLVIIIPDHGFLYDLTYDSGDFFHSPMLWTGGAIRKPRRMPTLMNQSDIAATLLAQMGLSHEDYPWSRNVLAPDYRPFVYCNYPTGIYYRDPSGETLYDLSAGLSLPFGTEADSARLNRALRILGTSYRQSARL